MAIYEVYYREKWNNNDPLKVKSISAHTRQSALTIARGVIPKNMVVKKCEKVG